jgi:hypothetical protein
LLLKRGVFYDMIQKTKNHPWFLLFFLLIILFKPSLS